MAAQGRMARMFEAFDRLSTREKVLVSGLVVGLLATLMVVVWMVINRQIEELEIANEATRESIEEIQMAKQSFMASKAELAESQAQLENNTIKLVRVMEKEAKALDIRIQNFKENRRPLTENYRLAKKNKDGKKSKGVKDLVEESQTVTLKKISLDQLSKFMRALEQQKAPVRVTQLSVNTSLSNRQELREVKLTVATYRMEVVEN
ncbi:MAG: hypothetical protein ACE366_05790 [Bradymonadia bacterium]